MSDLPKTTDPKPPVQSGGKLGAFAPQNIEEAFRLSQALARAGDMIPQHFQGKPEQIMAAVMRGAEIGLAPMQALSNIAVINGRATIWGDAIPALVQRAGHSIDVEIQGEGESAVAIATLERGDTGKQVVRRFSMRDAKLAGLAGKKGPWQNYPTRMLAHRARTWAVRDGAADALMGLQVSDEVQDYGPDSARDITPRRRRTGYTLAAPDDSGKGGGTSTSPVDSVPEPEPERDEIIDQVPDDDGPTTPGPLSPRLEGIANQFLRDFDAAEDIGAIDEIMTAFEDDLAEIGAASSDALAAINAAAEAARKRLEGAT